jgi:anti-anti-sigma regulatory factor
VTGIGDIRVERGGGDLGIASLSGEHDFSNVADLDEALRQVHTHGTQMVLDLSEASFIDSSVIGSVVREARGDARRPGDDLAVVAPAGSQARRVLELEMWSVCGSWRVVRTRSRRFALPSLPATRAPEGVVDA